VADLAEAKVTLTLQDLGVLSATAQRNGTEGAFVVVAMQWASEAQKEIERLRADYRLAEAEIRECTLMGVESRLRVRALEAEVEALRPDADRWRWWRQHWRALTTMAVVNEVGLDLRERGVWNANDMDEVTDAALRGKVSP
jgi:hypothetical protein